MMQRPYMDERKEINYRTLRLVHHSVILELNIPIYRMEQAKKKKAEEG